MIAEKRGSIFIISSIIIVVALILAGTFFYASVNEKTSADKEKFTFLAMDFAEAGVSQGISELRERIKTDLKNNIEAGVSPSVFNTYIASEDSLSILRDYAYASGDTQFTIDGDTATLVITPLDLLSIVAGNFTATIEVTKNGAPTHTSGFTYVFPYSFEIYSEGTVTEHDPNITKRVRLTGGEFALSVSRDNFAKYALFTVSHKTPGGQTVWFTNDTQFTGPVSTNDRFSFANNPGAVFTEEVTQHLKKARYYNNGRPKLIADDHNGIIDVPDFQKGFVRGYDTINLEPSIGQSELKYEASASVSEMPTDGIYIPNDGSNLTGGIYIKGDSDIEIGKDVSDNPQYTIIQGATTKVITIDYDSDTTDVDGDVYNGIPDGVTDEGILIYANGEIDSFEGLVQKDTQLTVASERDINITDHVLYEEYDTTPVLNADSYTNLLGILSWGGDVVIDTSAPDDLNVHGVVMAHLGSFEVDDYNKGSARGDVSLLGGMIAKFYGPFGTFSGESMLTGYGRDFVYDGRMLLGSSPPFFPIMTSFTVFEDGGLSEQLIWKEE
ncbi:MAG: DUF4900 domain-containing protein [Candidatus Gygaella obscura]|nr:DUF4900 domain-containing protein [Candidatus Gygaella obscura]